MRITVILLALICCACQVQTVNQSPEKQKIADEVYARILSGNHPDLKSGHFAIAACIAWQGSTAAKISGINAYYIDAGWAVYQNPMPDLRFAALGDCNAEKSAELPCTCEIVGENGNNLIKVP